MMNTTAIHRLIQNQRLSVLPVMAVALTTRLLGIVSRPLWYDEAFSVLFSEKGPAAMFIGTLTPTATGAADVHPITYYTMLWAWIQVFGESPVAVRALSITIGLGVVLVIYLLARALFSQSIGVAAALVAALSPFQVHYGQEIRMYGLLALWLLLTTYCYWQGSQTLTHPTDRSDALAAWPWWLGFAVFAALAQFTHNLTCFYLVSLALWPVLRREWRVVMRVAASGALAILLYLPWLVHLPSQFAKVELSYWVDRPGLYRLFTLLLYYVTNLPLPGWHLAAGLLVALLVTVIGLLQTVRAVHLRQAGAQSGMWLLYLAFLPALLMFLFSQWRPVYIERALLPSGAVFCIWLAWSMLDTRLPRPVQATIAALLIVGSGLGLYDHLAYAGFPYAPYGALDKSLRSTVQPGDAIIHSSKLSMLPAVYYDRSLPQSYVADIPGSGQDTLALSTQQVLGLPAKPDIQSAAGSARRVWFVIFDQSIQEYQQAGYSTDPQLAWLMQSYKLLQTNDLGDLRVYLFAKGP